MFPLLESAIVHRVDLCYARLTVIEFFQSVTALGIFHKYCLISSIFVDSFRLWKAIFGEKKSPSGGSGGSPYNTHNGVIRQLAVCHEYGVPCHLYGSGMTYAILSPTVPATRTPFAQTRLPGYAF
jgi:hypothetical protein